MKQMVDTRPCRGCHHTEEVHRHYRRGSDCGWCGCPQFRAPRRVFAARLRVAVARRLTTPALPVVGRNDREETGNV